MVSASQSHAWASVILSLGLEARAGKCDAGNAAFRAGEGNAPAAAFGGRGFIGVCDGQRAE